MTEVCRTMRVLGHECRKFQDLKNTNVLFYWPHGLGDWVFFSHIAPLLEPSNKYYMTRLGDDYVSVLDGYDAITPLYTGVKQCADFFEGRKNFGISHGLDGSERQVWLPNSLYQQCETLNINTLFYTGFPEVYGGNQVPYHTKIRNLMMYMLPHNTDSNKINNPLKGSINFEVPEWIAKFTEARLTSLTDISPSHKICLIGRTGYTSLHKNWGHQWRNETNRLRQEGEECREFMKLMLQKNPNWRFIAIEDSDHQGVDTLRSKELKCVSYWDMFGGANTSMMPLAMTLKYLINRADLVVGVPAGPYHLSMANYNVPTIGIWIAHLPSWYDEPKDASVHLIGKNTQKEMQKPGSFDTKDAFNFNTIHLDTCCITEHDVINAVEMLGV